VHKFSGKLGAISKF